MFSLKNYRYRIALSFLLIVIPITIGTVGYMLIEDLNFIEAVYMSVITIATVGYGEVQPLTDAGRIFTIFLILTNLGLFAYAIGLITNTLIQNDFFEKYKSNKMKQRIAKLNNHIIVCGYGRNGQEAIEVLKRNNMPFVVIESNPHIVTTQLADTEVLHLNADATTDEVLITAGIEHAFGLITTLPDDAANVYVTLTAREINNSMVIVSRASHDNSVKKLKRAGANNVIMPDKIGGAHMATLMVQPDVKEFIDILTSQGTDASIEEFAYDKIKTKLPGKTIQELHLRAQTGVNVIGLKKQNGDYIINPESNHELSDEYKLIVLGTAKQMQSFKELLKK
jgi:voltage-gated potassium channel